MAYIQTEPSYRSLSTRCPGGTTRASSRMASTSREDTTGPSGALMAICATFRAA